MDRFPELLAGAVLTIRLSALTMLFGLIIGTICSIAKVYGARPVQWLVNVYVEFIRNTPFLIQLYFVFFALPQFGRWDRFRHSDEAAYVGLTLPRYMLRAPYQARGKRGTVVVLPGG